MIIEGKNLFQLKTRWDAILSAFCQYMYTNKSFPTYKKLKEEHHNISKFNLPPDTHSKYATEKETFEAFSISLRVYFVKDTTKSSFKAPK